MRTLCSLYFVLASIAGVFAVTVLPPRALADITIHVGPPSVGNGQPNPVSIPPINPIEYEAVIVWNDGTELSLGIFPGIFWGHRFASNRKTYASLGVGGVFDINGVGPGIYSAIGADLCGFLCFNIEYKQALGISLTTPTQILSPYALRIGVTLQF